MSFFADEPHQTRVSVADYGVFQLLEVIRLEGHPMVQEDAFVSRDIHLLQVDSRLFDYRTKFLWTLMILYGFNNLIFRYVVESTRTL